MGYLVDKINAKFEWYRFCLPHRYKLVFDRIIAKSAENEQTLTTVPEIFIVVVLNELIDLEERLQRLEAEQK